MSPRIIPIILAGGDNKRHRALTDYRYNPFSRPKGALPVGNRLLIDFGIEAIKKTGANEIFALLGHHPQVEKIERQIINQDAYLINIKPLIEEKPLDTAGAVKYALNKIPDLESADTIMVLPCDTVHNIDLNPILQSHLKSNASLTIGVLPLQWSSPEWEERSFGTVKLQGMPTIDHFVDRYDFEENIFKYAEEKQGDSIPVIGFYEKQPRDLTQSNLINTGIYFFKADFLMELAPFITNKDAEHRFSDFGMHILPFLGKRHGEFTGKINGLTPLRDNVLKGAYPFYGYILPPHKYWVDVYNPATLFRVNMDVLTGKLDTQLTQDLRFWHKEAWGWLGHFNTKIYKDAQIAPPVPGTIGSIIGSHTIIKNNARIENSIILDNCEIAGELSGTICFPGSKVGRGVILTNSVVAGGRITYDRVPRGIDRSIVYENSFGGISFDPIF